MRDVDPADLGAAIYDLLETFRSDRTRFEAEARQVKPNGASGKSWAARPPATDIARRP
jgi:hypothetical protein